MVKETELQTFGVYSSDSSDQLSQHSNVSTTRIQLNNQDLESSSSILIRRNNVMDDQASDAGSTISRKSDRSPGSSVKKLKIKSSLNFSLPSPFHLPHHQSVGQLTTKIFGGKGIKRLRSISAKRRHKKKSKTFAKRRKLNRILNAKWMMILMIICTLYLIYIDDFMLATGAPDNTLSYTIVSVLKIVVLVIFVLEMIAQIFVQRLHYVISFFFIIDLISIASLIPDVVGFIFGIKSIVHAINSLSLGRTARVARIASRLSRVARIVIFFTSFSLSSKSKTTGRNRDIEDEEKLKIATEPSTIGKKILSKSTHKLVVMVLILVLITSLTSMDTEPTENAYHSVLELFIYTASLNGVNSPQFQTFLQEFTQDSSSVKLLTLKLQNTEVYNSGIDTSDWFNGYIIESSQNDGQDEIRINNKHSEQVSAALGITLTTCVILVLCFGTLLMSRDFQMLVIQPIERMVSLIKKISAMDRYDGTGSERGDSETIDDVSDFPTDNEYDTSAAESGDESDGTISGFDDDDDHETGIIVDLLSDMAMRKMEHRHRERQVIEVQTQFTTGMHALASAAAAFIQRKRYKEELKLYKRRAHIVTEIMTTEQTYVNSLWTAIEGYLMPLRCTAPPLIEAHSLNTIFGNIEVLHQYHKEFLEKLTDRVKNWSLNTSVGDLMISLEENIVDIYSIYINNYNNVMKEVELVRKEEAIADFFNHQRESKCKGIDILAYLIMPVQRMPRYVLLLEDLLKNTPSQYFDYDQIGQATRALKRATVVLNERKREAENKHSIQDIYMKLVPPLPDILVPGNCVFLQSKLKNDGEKFIFILLGSGLIKAEKSGNELNVKQYYNQIRDTVCCIPVQDCPNLRITNFFQIKVSNDEYILLQAKTPELRQEWIDAFAQFIKMQVSRTKSMQFINHTKRASGRGSISSSTNTQYHLTPGSPHRQSVSNSLSPRGVSNSGSSLSLLPGSTHSLGSQPSSFNLGGGSNSNVSNLNISSIQSTIKGDPNNNNNI